MTSLIECFKEANIHVLLLLKQPFSAAFCFFIAAEKCFD